MSVIQFNLDNISNPAGDFAIVQGETYDCVTILTPEDFSAWTPYGQIKRNYPEKIDRLLATFSFEPLIYGEVTLDDGTTAQRTTIKPILSSAASIRIPSTRDRLPGAKPIPGINCWVYDIKLVSPGGLVNYLVNGFVQVIPTVTR